MNTSSRAYDVVRKHDRVSSRSLSTRTPRARDPHVTATRALGGASASAPRLSSRRVRGATHPRRRRAHRGNPGEGKAAWISATRTSSRARDARTRPFRPTQQRRAFFCKASRSRTEPHAHASSCSESARRRSRARRVGAPPPRRVARHRANARRRPRNPRPPADASARVCTESGSIPSHACCSTPETKPSSTPRRYSELGDRTLGADSRTSGVGVRRRAAPPAPPSSARSRKGKKARRSRGPRGGRRQSPSRDGTGRFTQHAS